MTQSARKCSVFVSIVAIACLGLQPAAIAAQRNSTVQSVLLPLAKKGTSLDVEKMRKRSATLRDSKYSILREYGDHIQLWINVLSAETPAELHKRVRELPVKIERTQTSDGRIVTKYTANDKTQFSTTSLSPNSPRPAEEVQSGPSASARDLCFEDEEEPCSTEEEMDDLGIYIADAEATNDAYQADYDNYCAQNWEICMYDQEFSSQSGPSASDDARFGCGQEARNATSAMVGGAIVILNGAGKLADARIAGKTLSNLSRAGVYVAVGAAAWTAGFYGGYFLACFISQMMSPSDLYHEDKTVLFNPR